VKKGVSGPENFAWGAVFGGVGWGRVFDPRGEDRKNEGDEEAKRAPVSSQGPSKKPAASRRRGSPGSWEARNQRFREGGGNNHFPGGRSTALFQKGEDVKGEENNGRQEERRK